MDFNTKCDLIKGPPNFCNIAEAKMHDGIADYFSKVAEKHPTAGKLGAIPVCIVTLASKSIFALAMAVEAVARLIFNLVGAIFSEKCRKDLSEALSGIVHYTVCLAITPLLTLFNTILNTAVTAKNPTLYKTITAAKLALALLTKSVMNNIQSELATPPQGAKKETPAVGANNLDDKLYNQTNTLPIQSMAPVQAPIMKANFEIGKSSEAVEAKRAAPEAVNGNLVAAAQKAISATLKISLLAGAKKRISGEDAKTKSKPMKFFTKAKAHKTTPKTTLIKKFQPLPTIVEVDG